MNYKAPNWSALAVSALARLRDDHVTLAQNAQGEDVRRDRQPRERPQRKMSDRNPDWMLDALAESPDAMQIPAEEQEAVRAQGGDPLAVDGQGRNRPAIHLPPKHLSLVLRLCATIGDEARIADMLAPGAVTVIELGKNKGGMSPSDVRIMLETTLLPDEADVETAPLVPRRTSLPDLCIVGLAAEEANMPGKNAQDLQTLMGALEEPCPILILAETLSRLPADVLRVLPAPLRLAPVSRDILIAMISASHSATGKIDPKLFDHLPEDRLLARLSRPSLALALRAETPSGVADQLLQFTGQKADDGPCLDDIEGYGEAEAVARRMVADLIGWSDGRIAWADVQRSVLFWGLPGTGKSYLARAMAGSAGVAQVRGSFARWQAQGHLGHMLKAMRASFAEAAEARPAILIIDEIDAVGDRADPDTHNANYRQQVINGFLEELDCLKHLEGVLLVATSNYPDRIDAAVLRPGRIDIRAQVPLPGTKALARMIRDGLNHDVAAQEMARLIRAAAGQSAADVESALRQARAAARQEHRGLMVPDVLAALRPEPVDEHPARDRRIALHECGHAIVGTYLGVGRVERLAFARQGGQAWLRSASGESLLPDLEAQLAYSLAGRAAERVILGEAAAGAGGNAGSDLAHATTAAVRIDTHSGLGVEGLVWLDMPPAVYLRDPDNAARIRARLEDAEGRAMQILECHRDLLLGMAAALEKAGMLEGAALETWTSQIRTDENPEPSEADSNVLGLPGNPVFDEG